MDQELSQTPISFELAVGQRIKARRIELGMTQDQLVAEVNRIHGRAWGKREMSLIENGKRTELSGRAIAAFARALDTTMQQLLKVHEPVDLGGGERDWLDALAAGDDSTPDERVWAKARKAGQLLYAMRGMWEDYGDLIYSIRGEIQHDPSLADGIEEAHIQRGEATADDLAATHTEREGEFKRGPVANANATPMMVALRDSLGSSPQPANPWARWEAK